MARFPPPPLSDEISPTAQGRYGGPLKTWLMDVLKLLIRNTQGGWSEGPTETSVECPCVQEPGDEDPVSRHGEGPVGGCDKVGDPRLSNFVCSLPFLFLDWKGVRFLDEEICCYATRISSAGLYLASSGLVLRNQCQTIFSPSRVTKPVGVHSLPFSFLAESLSRG